MMPAFPEGELTMLKRIRRWLLAGRSRVLAGKYGIVNRSEPRGTTSSDDYEGVPIIDGALW